VATLLALACRPSADQPAVTLRVLNWATDIELSGEQRVADRWAETRPGVRVIVESITSNYGEKLATSIASGAPPDVFLLDSPDIPAFVDRGLALDLTPYVGRVGYDTAAVFPQVMEIFRRGPQLFAFPKGFTPLVIYYNRRLFRELGVPVPPDTGWTWEGFLATARQLTRDLDGDGRVDTYALSFPRQLYEWVPFVWSAGGDILDPTGTRTAGYLDGPAAVATFEFLTSLVTTHRVAPPVQFLTAGDAMRIARFYLGRQGMLVSGHWQLPRLVEYARRGDLEIGVAPVPRRGAAPFQTALYASGWAVPANVRHRRLAIELAAFLAGADAQRMRAAARLELPVFAAVAREVAAADTSGVEAAFLALVPAGRQPWGATVVDFFEIEDLSFDIMDRVLLRGEPAADAARAVARRIDRAMAR
jgi:multiple sugar transport system substrate-binding protein